ncbi:MAG: PHP domain-containing protein [Fibromonadales bacterium]|nr:PHP domain-containing protein [Fibromonadales bacterium]
MLDLHVHTTFSDGQYTPEEIVNLAVQAGIDTLSITDHDSIAGLPSGKAAADKAGIKFINGIEISCQGNRELHLLGYNFDYNEPILAATCMEFARLREERAHRIIDFLLEKGVKISLDEVREIAHGSAIIGRPHFALVLLKHGCVASIQEAFDKYLAAADFDKIERPKPTAEEGISLIKNAGGIPVLAHPALLKLKPEAEEELIKRLVGFGLVGMECFYSLHSPEQVDYYCSIAEKYNLIVTGGSDFHGEKIKPKIKMGVFLQKPLDKPQINF